MKRSLLPAIFAALLTVTAFHASASDISPKGEALIKELDSFDVTDLWLAHHHVDWKTGQPDNLPVSPEKAHTHCSAFVAAACMRLGVYILRPPHHGQDFLASAQSDWLLGAGRGEGWQRVGDTIKAQRLANEGNVVVAVFHSPDPKKSGHVAIVRPSAKSDALVRKEGPDVTQAGMDNYNSTSLQVGFSHHPGAFEQHQILFFSHVWNQAGEAPTPSIFSTPSTSPTPVPAAISSPAAADEMKAGGQGEPALATAPAPKGIPPVSGTMIRVALYSDIGSKHGGDRVEKCLDLDPGKYQCFQVDAEDIRGGVLKTVDVLVQGGGSGSACAKALQPAGCDQIRQFVKNGGGYLGICAGSYLASSDYPWSLHIFNSKVIDRQHWARGKGSVELRFTETGKARLGVKTEIVNCNYGQGPLMAPADEPGLPPYDTLATFETEVAKNGAPSGVMKGTTALASSTFGQGKVICISPHPEGTDGLDGIIRHAVQWILPAHTVTANGAGKAISDAAPPAS